MRGLAFRLFFTAYLYAIAGMAFGIHMSVVQDLEFGPAHIHLNLLGCVSMALVLEIVFLSRTGPYHRSGNGPVCALPGFSSPTDHGIVKTSFGSPSGGGTKDRRMPL